jgi:hypothetical protein
MDAIGSHPAGHDHAQDVRDYYIEQLLSVFISGAFGITGVLMYQFDMLKFILAEPFRLPVLLGGFGLIGLAAFRGVALWLSVGGDHFHDHHLGHNHAPGEPCDHPDGEEHEAHSHGGAYWRIVVLLFPVLLFLMGVPNGTFSEDWINKRLGAEESLGALGDVAEKGGGENVYDFPGLSMAANSAEKREALTGTKASIKGQLRRIPGSSTEFGLFYLKITCCATDMVPLRARVVVGSASLADAIASKYKDHSWVEVTGTLQFAKDSQGQFITVLRVKDNGGITAATPQY